jgi:hypothetical protein
VPPGPEARYGVHFLSSGPGGTPLLSPLARTLGASRYHSCFSLCVCLLSCTRGHGCFGSFGQQSWPRQTSRCLVQRASTRKCGTRLQAAWRLACMPQFGHFPIRRFHLLASRRAGTLPSATSVSHQISHSCLLCSFGNQRRLTYRSMGGPTACHQAWATAGCSPIFCGPGLASHRWPPH